MNSLLPRKPGGTSRRLDYDAGMVRNPLLSSSLVLLGTLAAFSSSCSALGPCDRSDQNNSPDPYYDGTAVDGFYMLSDWTGPFLPFLGGKRYRFFHGLGVVPREMACWASFNSTGILNGSIAPPAGNMCVIQEINNEFIQIKNDTCSEMYVMVTASVPWPAEDSEDSEETETWNEQQNP